MAKSSDEPDITKIQTALERAGVLPSDEKALAQISEQLSKQGIDSPSSAKFLCNRAHWCLVVPN
jgi:hypothetical protein